MDAGKPELRKGTGCRSPAVRGKIRRRMHGGAAGSGGPTGERNGNYRLGLCTQDAMATRRRICKLLREARTLTVACLRHPMD